MTIYGPIAIGVPPNMSLLAAMSAGIIPANIFMSATTTKNPGAAPTLMSSLSSCGANGTINKGAGITATLFNGNGPSPSGSATLPASGDGNQNGLNAALVLGTDGNNVDFGG